jgi:plasmid stability protein
MAQVLIRKLEKSVVDDLKKMAKSHHRSLEAELREIVTGAVRQPRRTNMRKLKRAQKLFAGLQLPDSTQLIREDRDR